MALSTSAALASLDDCLDAVCRIHEGDGIGSGCVFQSDSDKLYVLTNAHVAGVRPGSPVECEFWRAGYASRRLPGTVEWGFRGADGSSQSSRDLAVVSVAVDLFQGELPRVIPLADENEQIAAGDAVVSVGCSKGAWPSLFRGHVLAVDNRGGLVLDFTPPPANGRSGSAVVDPAGEKIVGVIAWRSDEEAKGIAMTVQEVYAAFRGDGPVRWSVPRLLTADEVNASGMAEVVRAPVAGGCPPWQPFCNRGRGGNQNQNQGPKQNQNQGGGAWTGRPGSSAAPAAIDTSKFALKSDLQALSTKVDSLAADYNQTKLGHLQLGSQFETLGTQVLRDAGKSLETKLQAAIDQKLPPAVASEADKLGQLLNSKLSSLDQKLPVAVQTAVAGEVAKLGAAAAGTSLPGAAALATGLGGPIGGGLAVGLGVLGLILKRKQSAAPAGAAPGGPFRSSA